jgi:hypothetical protein
MAHKMKMLFFLYLTSFALVSAGEAQASQNLKYALLPHFRLNYDKNIPGKDVQLVEKELQRAFELFQKRLSFSPPSKINVYLYSSKGRPLGTLLYKVFDDSYYSDGKIVILSSSLHDEKYNLHSLIDRVVARAFLSGIIVCPAWMAETYALAVGYDFTNLGKPTRGNLASFSDLGEDIARADNATDLKAVYANLSATAKYFMDQYGEDKLDAMIKLLHAGHSLNEAMENALGGKYNDIEHAWGQYMRSVIKG